jgi:hypothetical protein
MSSTLSPVLHTAPRSVWRSAAPLAVAMLALLALPGCKRFTRADCNKPQGYEQAQNLQGLRIPGGLDPLNTRGALKIPELREPEAPRNVNDACLEEPPKFSNARLMPLVRDKATVKAEKKAADAAAKKANAEAKAKKKADAAADKAAAKK